MKKIGISLATLALSASASALIHTDPTPQENKTYCLTIYQNAKGAKYLGGCDESNNNRLRHRALNSEGCAQNQAALSAYRVKGSNRPFTPEIHSCLAPNIAQL